MVSYHGSIIKIFGWIDYISFLLYSAGLEIFEELNTPPDIVLVCCGGGGLCAGVAAALKLSGWEKTRIYAVEAKNGKFA